MYLGLRLKWPASATAAWTEGKASEETNGASIIIIALPAEAEGGGSISYFADWK